MSITTHTFADAVGRKNIANANGVGLTQVSNQIVRGQFPASWFLTCSVLAASVGVECPDALFAFKEPNNGATQKVKYQPKAYGAEK